MPKDSVEGVEWVQYGTSVSVFVTTGGEVRGFSGFHRSDVLSLRDHLSKRFDMELKEGKRAVRGGNWGDMRLDGE